MAVPKNSPGSFQFSDFEPGPFCKTSFSLDSLETLSKNSHFFPNISMPIPTSTTILTKNRPPYQPYSQWWPVSVTDARTSSKCHTPKKNTAKGHKSQTDNFFFIFSFPFIHLSRRFPMQLPVLPALPLFLPEISAPGPFSGSAPSACFQAGITGSSCQMPLRSAKRS